MAGCGNTYRPVESAINPVGPAGQPTKYAIAVSSPSPTSNGLMTMVDFSGDTTLVTVALGVNPYYMILNPSGTEGYTLNSDKTVTSFEITPQLIQSDVTYTTLLPGANPVAIFPSSTATYIADPGVVAVDALTGTPPALKQELSIGPNPIYVVGNTGATRAYGLSQGTGTAAGTAAAIELGANTISATLPVGRNPVYGVMSIDGRRAFVLNQGDGTVSVINAVTNQLDTLPSTTNPAQPVSTIPVGVAPVWADVAPTLNEIVVANQGNGTTPGTLTVISTPLCSTATLPTNPNCDPTNPVDATQFGTVQANVPVGINPIMVSVLSDGSRAYVANAGNPALPCSPTGVPVAGVSTTCTVSVVNLTSNTVTATIPIAGHPAYIATANASPTGKVYVVCHDSQVMTVIRTDEDVVDTTIPLQGYGVSVRVTVP